MIGPLTTSPLQKPGAGKIHIFPGKNKFFYSFENSFSGGNVLQKSYRERRLYLLIGST